MSYIGNAKTPLLLASNVRDDLVPNGTNVFELSQEVPGGEAVNVCVVRRRYLTDVLVNNTDLIEFSAVPGSTTKSQIIIQDNYLASAFSVVNPTSSNTRSADFADGDIIRITYQDGSISKGLNVESISYNRDSLTITLGDTVDIEEYVALGTTIAKVERNFYGPWEILDPETQYEIISTSGFTNRKIEIKDLTPNEFDVLYVLHRGEGTYNFVPSPYSVGPEQLSPNLRNFAVDSQTYTTPGEKTLTLSQSSPAASTLIVTANGVVQVSTNEQNSGTWTLNDVEGTSQTITLKESLFTNAGASAVAIRVLHLSFSTVSRRASFVVGQDPKFIETGAVSTNALAQSSVTTEKISDDSVIGTKILLRKQDSLRFKTSSSTEIGVIKLDQTNNDTQLVSDGSVQIKPSNSTYTFGETSITPATTNAAGISLGSSVKPFKNLYVSGSSNLSSITVENITVTGNITIEENGTIDSTDVSVLRDDVDALTDEVKEIIKFLIPIGTIVPTAAANTPTSTKYGEWVLCDGRKLLRSNYNELFNALGGETQKAAGWSWGVCDDYEFSIPDLRRRSPLGKSGSDTLGSNDGVATPSLRALSHTHEGPEHTHTISHTHTIPGHKHTVVPGAAESISISSSGGHQTNIQHNHNQGTLTTNLTSVNHYHQLTHSHSSSTGGNIGGDDHSHTGSTGGGSQHRHSIECQQIKLNTGSSYPSYWVLGGTARDGFISMESSHSHAYRTDSAAITHHHNFSIPAQTNDTGGALSSVPGLGNDLSHAHVFSVPSSSLDRTTSTSGGEHTHDRTSFTGFIGTSKNDPEGNTDSTTPLTTSAQSTTTSGAANYTNGTSTNKTGAATLPHIVVNYMIKAK